MYETFGLPINPRIWTAEISTMAGACSLKVIRAIGAIGDLFGRNEFYLAGNPEAFSGDFRLSFYRRYGAVRGVMAAPIRKEPPEDEIGNIVHIPKMTLPDEIIEEQIAVSLFLGEDVFDELWLRHRSASKMPNTIVLEIGETASLSRKVPTIWDPAKDRELSVISIQLYIDRVSPS